jgi:hypothetical protein
MLNHFRHHLAAGKPSPGLLIVSQRTPIVLAAESVIIFWAVTNPAELRDQAYHLPSLVRHVFAR